MGTHLLPNLAYDEIKTEDVPMENRILGQMACAKGNEGGPISRTEKL